MMAFLFFEQLDVVYRGAIARNYIAVALVLGLWQLLPQVQEQLGSAYMPDSISVEHLENLQNFLF